MLVCISVYFIKESIYYINELFNVTVVLKVALYVRVRWLVNGVVLPAAHGPV